MPDVGTAYLPPDGEEVADGEDEEDEFAQMASRRPLWYLFADAK